MNASDWIRRFHRWMSIAFTLTVVANFIAMAQGRGTPPPWITYTPLLPLAFLLLTGLYLFEPDPVWWTPRSHDERYPRTAGSVARDEPGTGRRWVTRCFTSAPCFSSVWISARQRRSNSAGAMLPSEEWRRSVL